MDCICQTLQKWGYVTADKTLRNFAEYIDSDVPEMVKVEYFMILGCSV